MTKPNDWPRAILFDLDGTLVDSAPDLHEALNEAVAEIGLPPFALEDVHRMIGGGVDLLIDRALDRRSADLDPGARRALVARFMALYEPRATRLTRLLPGAREALAQGLAHGAKIALVTNKPASPARMILERFEIASHFDIVVGGDAGPAKKPAPDLFLLAASTFGRAPKECLVVGDSENDARGAKAAGMSFALLSGGYTAVPPEEIECDWRLDSLSNLSEILSEYRDP